MKQTTWTPKDFYNKWVGELAIQEYNGCLAETQSNIQFGFGIQ